VKTQEKGSRAGRDHNQPGVLWHPARSPEELTFIGYSGLLSGPAPQSMGGQSHSNSMDQGLGAGLQGWVRDGCSPPASHHSQSRKASLAKWLPGQITSLGVLLRVQALGFLEIPNLLNLTPLRWEQVFCSIPIAPPLWRHEAWKEPGSPQPR
jgi:hypothetical protein